MSDQNIEWTREFVAWPEEGASQAEIKRILAEHRKMIIKGIREDISSIWHERYDLDKPNPSNPWDIVDAMLALPCLKEKE